jgi:hypothetical protein
MRQELQDVRLSVSKEVSRATEAMGSVITETRPLLHSADLNRVLSQTEPIVEPGGELPPERNGSESGA